MSSSLEFSVEEEVIIPEEGKVKVPIIAANGGIASNTKAETVILMLRPIEGISRLYNEEDITGGTDEEDNESYRERIMEAYDPRGPPTSEMMQITRGGRRKLLESEIVL